MAHELARARALQFGSPMRGTWRTLIVVLVIVGSRSAAAEPVHALYVEAFGKGGLWGLGYDHRIARRVAIGAVGSGHSLEGQRYIALSPYIGLYLARHGRSAWFADVGATLAHVWSVSPVPEWPGESSSGIGGMVSTGYEFRGRLLFRLFVHGVVGQGGAHPWAGSGVGWTF